jgi:NAD(P)-dependent dehydrogenase (short-subunit alcohol dehydrogenase family)
MVMQQTKSPARPSLNRSLEGQRVVIIGGTSGFGITAKAASAEGASVIVASSKKANVDRAIAELPASAGGHALDITQESAVRISFRRLANLIISYSQRVSHWIWGARRARGNLSLPHARTV